MREESLDARRASLLRSLCAGSIGFFVCCGLLLILAVLLERGVLPDGTAQIAAYSAIMVSVVLTAFVAAGNGNCRILGSLFAGIVFLLFAGACGMVLGGAISLGRAVFLFGLVSVSSVLGALLSGLIRG